MSKKNKTLPKPTGPYQVGRTHLNFIDEDRLDPFPLAGGKKRDIPILIWYPIDDPGDTPPLKLLKHRDLESLKKLSIYKLIPKGICDIGTNSYENMPISSKNTKFPLLIFNYGFTSLLEQSTILMEHLTSYGYIVVSVGHPYDGVASYPDGRSIPMDVEFVKKYNKKMRKEKKNFKYHLKQLQKEDLTVDEMKKFTENYLMISEIMNDKVEIWVDDVIFITNVLESMNKGTIKSQFEQKIALEKGIGLFGHSYGGVTSILSCCLDDRFKCGINMDGGMYGGLKQKFKYFKPSFFMDSDTFPGMNKYFYNINENDTYHIIIKDSKHLDYSDYTYLLKNWFTKLLMFGKIDGNLMINIVNNYVQSFFDKYIKGIDTTLLENNPYSQVIFEKRN